MIKLKPITKNDCFLYCQLYQDKGVLQYVCEPLSEIDCKTSFSKLIKRTPIHSNKRKCFVIEYVKKQELVGIIDAKYDPIEMQVEVGILISPQYHGLGIGPLAHGLLFEEKNRSWPTARLVARCHENNFAANQMYHKLGFKKNNNKTNKITVWEKK